MSNEYPISEAWIAIAEPMFALHFYYNNAGSWHMSSTHFSAQLDEAKGILTAQMEYDYESSSSSDSDG